MKLYVTSNDFHNANIGPTTQISLMQSAIILYPPLLRFFFSNMICHGAGRTREWKSTEERYAQVFKAESILAKHPRKPKSEHEPSVFHYWSRNFTTTVFKWMLEQQKMKPQER